VPAPVRAVVLAITAAGIGALCGPLATSHYGIDVAAALVAFPIVVYLWPRPLPCLLLLVAVMSFAGYGSIPRVHTPGNAPVNFADVLLAVAVGGTLWRRPWRRWPPSIRRFAAALALLLAVAIIPTVALAVHGHAAFREALLGYKNLVYLLAALTVALELSGRQWRLLLNAAVALAAVIALASLAAAASGSIANVFNSLNSDAVLTLGTGGVARIRLPGLFFVYAMAIPTLVMVLLWGDRWRAARAGALALMLGAVAVSLNRNMYYGGGAAVLITVLLAGARFRQRFVLTLFALVAVGAAVVSLAVLPAVTAQVTQRAQSALTTNVLSSGSAQARSDELAHALHAVSQHPWTGVGWFQSYGSYVYGTPRIGVEDLYLHLATDLGIPAAAVFLLVPGVALGVGLRRVNRIRDRGDRALVAAGIGSVIAMLLSCLVGSYLQDVDTTLMFGVVCGCLLAAAVRADRRSVEPDGLARDTDGPSSGSGTAGRPGLVHR
jgi:O-antigen ligase